MTSDADLSGLGYEDALDYVRNFAITLKKYERDIARQAGQAELWRGRAELAERRGMLELAVQAREKAAGAQVEIARLEAEASRLRADLALMRPKLAALKGSPASPAEAELLAAEADLLADDPRARSAAAEEELKGLAADDALAKLKKRVNGGE